MSTAAKSMPMDVAIPAPKVMKLRDFVARYHYKDPRKKEADALIMAEKKKALSHDRYMKRRDEIRARSLVRYHEHREEILAYQERRRDEKKPDRERKVSTKKNPITSQSDDELLAYHKRQLEEAAAMQPPKDVYPRALASIALMEIKRRGLLSKTGILEEKI